MFRLTISKITATIIVILIVSILLAIDLFTVVEETIEYDWYAAPREVFLDNSQPAYFKTYVNEGQESTIYIYNGDQNQDKWTNIMFITMKKEDKITNQKLIVQSYKRPYENHVISSEFIYLDNNVDDKVDHITECLTNVDEEDSFIYGTHCVPYTGGWIKPEKVNQFFVRMKEFILNLELRHGEELDKLQRQPRDQNKKYKPVGPWKL